MRAYFGVVGLCLLTAACSEPPKPQTPALTPQVANEALAVNAKAKGWLEHARKTDPSCAYELDIPDQSSHPAQLDFTHVLKCGGRPAPLELDASVSFAWDPAEQHWTILRFSD